MEDAQHGLLGNAFCTQVVAWLLSGALAQHGFLEAQCSGDEAARCMQQHVEALADPGLLPSLQLARCMMSCSAYRGGDIRSTQPTQMGRKQPTSHCEPSFWKWRPVISAPWGLLRENINALEMRAYSMALKWRCRSTEQLHRRFVHYLDSQVTRGIAAKGRTSLWWLHPISLRISAYILAGALLPYACFCRSHTNPADAPSRVLPVKRPNRKGRRKHW